MESTLIDIDSASKQLNLSPQQIRNICRNGKLKGQKISGSWVLNQVDIDKFIDNNKSVITLDKVITSERLKMKDKKRKIALSFFSGAMGMDNGLEKAGFEVLLCSEIDKACRKTIHTNRPDVALIGDIRDYSAKDIRKHAGLTHNEKIDLVVGGPPCQAFSTAGNRKGFDDERGNVFLTFLERIIELKPTFAVIENVRGILSAPLQHRPHERRGFGYPPLTPDEEKGGALMHIVTILKKAGYGVTFNLYNSANFGTPQKRERVIIICSRNGKKLPYLVPTNSESGDFNLPKWKSFKNAVKGLPKQRTHLNFPEKRLQYYRLLKPGQYWKHLPKELQKVALGASYFAGGGKTGFLRRLAWDKPAPTLVTHPAMPATDLAHPVEDRPLSVEEYKRIQEFPDDWTIEGSLIDQYRQIGNAVPVSLGKAVGKLLIDYMEKRTIMNIKGFSYSRYMATNEITWEEKFNELQIKNKTEQLSLAI